MAEIEAPLDEESGLDSFPEEIREDVDGLMWLGHLEDSFDYCGHTIAIRTLKADEELEASLLTKDFMDSLGQAKAWAWANVAMALVSVDGDPDFCLSPGPDRRAAARSRFKYVTGKWYWHTGEYIFSRYMQLIERQLRAVEAVRDLSSRGLQASSQFADSLKDQADSEIMDLVEED